MPTSPEWSKAYYAKNRDKIRARVAAYRKTNAVKVKQAALAFRKKHRKMLATRSRQYAAKNAEKVKARNLAYRRRPEIAEKRRKYAVDRYANDPKVRRHSLRYQKRWRRANREKRFEYNARRRAAKLGRPVEVIVRAVVHAACCGRCYLCNDLVTLEEMHLDHKIPLCRGGSHTYANVGAACASCNLKKNKMTDAEFRQRLAARMYEAYFGPE